MAKERTMGELDLVLPPLPDVRPTLPPEPGVDPAEWLRACHLFRYFVPLVRNRRVLDLGCGRGDGAHLMAREAREVVAVDEDVARARERYPRWNLRFDAGDPWNPQAFGKFGALTALASSASISDPVRFLDGCGAALEDDGVLILAVAREPDTDIEGLRAFLRERFATVEIFGQSRHSPWRPAPGVRPDDRLAVAVCGDASLVRRLDRFLRPTGIVVVCRDGLELSDRCLRSVAQFTPEPAEIVVVNDATRDGTREWADGLAKDYRNVRVIHETERRGYAACANRGIAVLPDRDVVLLDHDVVTTPGWLGGLAETLRGDGGAGIVGAVGNDAGFPQGVTGPGDGNDVRELLSHAAVRAADRAGQRTEARRLSLFCALIRRDVVGRIGALDERFASAPSADDDYTFRTRVAGFRLWIASDVYVHRAGGPAVSPDARDWERFKAKWGLPPETEAGAPVPADAIPETDFDPPRDVIPLPCSASA
ncbi:MAG: glycosyltransferase [Planctomycetes bacterium]|nr:glycosyltransferase [Planctomycetota bacterium]